MNLPGKLILGFLQEDNPLKGYFRVRPLMVEDGAEFALVEDAAQTFLEDGYIRIVPDKNELSHFKSRMRSLGQYCLIDLRRHTGENDKIRPNKNYQKEDHNTYIVYSDVVLRLPDTYMAEVCEGYEFPRPGTKYVMLQNGETLDGPYEWEEAEPGKARLAGHVPADPDVAQPDRTRRVTLETALGEHTYLMRLDALGVRETDRRRQAPAPAAAPIAPPEAPAPAVTAETPAPAGKAETAPVQGEVPQPAVAEPQPETTPAAPESVTPVSPEPEPAPAAPAEAPQAEEAPAPEEAKNEPPAWIQKTHFPQARAVSARMSLREQSMVMQSGINPKRGASIRDVVDDQWRQSRIDQLGHPVPARSAAQPAASPVEEAVRAFKEAWSEPNARPGLVRELLRNSELAAALDLVKSLPDDEDISAATRALTDLEAERLKLLSEVDKLRRDKEQLREDLLAELKKEHARELDQLDRRKAALAQEIDAAKADAVSAEKAAQAAEAAYDKLMGGNADEKLCDMLVGTQAAGLLQQAVFGRVAPPKAPETAALSAGEMIADLRVRFEKAGVELSNDDAAHALVCLALGRIQIVSGPSGADGSARVRLLASALGLTGAERFAEIRARRHMGPLTREISERASGAAPVIRRPDVKTLLDASDGLAPSLLMISDANRTDAGEMLGELMDLGQSGAPDTLHGGVDCALSPALRLALTALDAPEGLPLSPELLDRAWFTRIYPITEDAPWKPAAEELPAVEKAVSLSALVSAFAPKSEPGEEVARRMADLRARLARLGVRLTRRALDDTWRYCAAARPYMRCDDAELLDRALACRAMPWILATAELPALHDLPEILKEYPRCLQLMEQPLPLPPV